LTDLKNGTLLDYIEFSCLEDFTVISGTHVCWLSPLQQLTLSQLPLSFTLDADILSALQVLSNMPLLEELKLKAILLLKARCSIKLVIVRSVIVQQQNFLSLVAYVTNLIYLFDQLAFSRVAKLKLQLSENKWLYVTETVPNLDWLNMISGRNRKLSQ
jgi:hypothetical protein